jgi:hypothetical protein
MAVPESQDGLEHKVQAAREMIHNLCSPRFAAEHREWEMSIPARPDYDPDLVIADAIRVLEAQLIATRAELRKCEMEKKAALGMEAVYLKSWQECREELADAIAQIANLTKGA